MWVKRWLSKHLETQPVFSFCTLVKFTSHFIPRKLYCTETHTHKDVQTSIALLRFSKKKTAIKKKKKEKRKPTQTRWVSNLQAEGGFFSQAVEKARRSKSCKLWSLKTSFLTVWSVGINLLSQWAALLVIISSFQYTTISCYLTSCPGLLLDCIALSNVY